MTEDKDIEAIAKYIHTDCVECKTGKAEMLLLELKFLGYVKLAEQKLPPYEGSYDDLKECYEEAQQDMLSVDSEGCAYRRVKVNG
jgi:hypothetical protein